MATVEAAIADPNVTITVSTNGFRGGTSVYEQVMSAVQRIAGGIGSNTDWELFRLWQTDRLREVNFVLNGNPITNPFK